MGRARKIDRESAQAAALGAFWQHGYAGLGVRRLEELTGINRFALQTEFGGKNGLFIELLNTYTSTWSTQRGESLRQGNLDELVAFFLARVRKKPGSRTNFGCLVCNLLADDQPDDPKARKEMMHFLDVIEGAFTQALMNERQQGTLADDVVIEDAGQMLLTTLIGINVTIKQHGRNEAALPTVRNLVTTILSWRKPATGDDDDSSN